VGGALVSVVLRGHPRLGRLLDDLLADRVHPAVEGRDGAGTGRARRGLTPQLLEEAVKRLHEARVCQVRATWRTRPPGGTTIAWHRPANGTTRSSASCWSA